MVENLPNMCDALDWISSTKNKRQNGHSKTTISPTYDKGKKKKTKMTTGQGEIVKDSVAA